jgi:hypothetical protein
MISKFNVVNNFIHLFFLGSSALSKYCQHFLEALDALTRECASKRDILMKKLLDMKQQENETQFDKKQEGN